MLPYVAIYTAASLVAWSIRRRAAASAALLGLTTFLTVFAGTRDRVGCDFYGYLNRFELVAGGAPTDTSSEPAFFLLTKTVVESGLSYYALLGVASIIYCTCLWAFARTLRDPLSFLVTAFPILILQLGMSGIRQALALGFLCLAYASFVRRQRILTAAWIVLGSGFHLSVAVFLPLAWLAGRRISATRVLTSLVVLGPVTGWTLSDRIVVYSTRYVEQAYGEQASGGAWYRYALLILPFLAFELHRERIRGTYRTLYPLLRVGSLASFGLASVGLVSSVGLHRLTFYLLPLSLVTLICVSHTVVGASSKALGRALPFLVHGLYLAAWFTSSRHASACYVPYRSWLLS